MLKLYSKKGCAECMLLKRKLENKGIEFEEIDLDGLDPQEIARIVQESGRKRMPVLEKEGKFLSDEDIENL
jgi:glutaredoxin